jgi:hypothetical protein
MRLTTSISFADADVPTKQHQEGKGKEGAGASDVNETVKKRLLELLEERPVWTRASITNQLTPEHARIVVKCVFSLPRLRKRTDAWGQSKTDVAGRVVYFLRWSFPRPSHSLWLRPSSRSRVSIVSQPSPFLSRCTDAARSYQHVVLRNVANVRVKHSVAVAMKGKTNKEATSKYVPPLSPSLTF